MKTKLVPANLKTAKEAYQRMLEGDQFELMGSYYYYNVGSFWRESDHTGPEKLSCLCDLAPKVWLLEYAASMVK